MQKNLSLIVIICAISFLAAAAFGLGIDEKPKNVILIGWDGAQRNHIKECLDKGELPNLKKVASEGTLAAIDILRITDTKAGWSQILTGYNPEITGVFSNGDYQPIPEGLTIFERLEKFFGANNFVTVAVIGKKGNVDNDPPKKVLINNNDSNAEKKLNKNEKQETKNKNKQLLKKNAAQPKKTKQQKKQQQKKVEGKIVVEKGKQYLETPGKPYYNASKHMDVFINGLMLNDRVASQTIALLEKYKDKPFFFFVHFAEIDHQGHKFGENSKEENDAYISSDKCTGMIIDKLKELKLYDKTLIYITSDHGFDEGKKAHKDAPYVFLATNDKKVVRRGERADITPTILERFGVDLSKITPQLDGKPLTKPSKEPLW